MYQKRVIAVKSVVFFLLLCVVPSEAFGKTPEGMALIPAGEFTMGTDEPQANADQRPAHKVYLDAFYMDKTEVTNAQFEEFILAGGYKTRKYWTKAGWEFIQKERFFYSSPRRETYRIQTPLAFGGNTVSTAPDHPVIGVSWYEAAAYATWAGKRLPTEAEWEKAARGTKERTYPWGNKMDFSKLRYFPHQEKVKPVGSFPKGASPYGVLDLAGSVWEWCADWYDENSYPQSQKKNPQGPATGDAKVLRGGGWDSIRLQLRCTHRYAEKPTHRAYTIGFRCVTDAN